MKSNISTWLGVLIFLYASMLFFLLIYADIKDEALLSVKWSYSLWTAIAGLSLVVLPQKTMVEIFVKFWNAVIKKVIGIIILVFLISSCTPEKRLSRLIKKHPELLKIDTIFTQDTLIFKTVKHDSIFSIHEIMGGKDTIIIQTDRLTQKIYTYRDSIYISGECAADTVIREIPTYITKIEIKDKVPWWWWTLFGILFISMLWHLIQRK